MSKLRVLVLEDHPFQKSLAVIALLKAGVTHVIEASEGQEALKKLKVFGRADIVICDLRMPGMDGLTFLREAYENDLAGSVILSSDADASLRQGVISMIDCLGLPFLGDLGKPFNLERLRLLLNRYGDLQQRQLAPRHPDPIPSLFEIRDGLQNGEFFAYYQPKIDLQTQKIAGAEVLARWQHPQRGLLAPGQFLPAVESFDLLDELYECLFEQGLQLQANLLRQDRRLELAFNLDASQLSSKGLPEAIREKLQQYQLPAHGLMFEVTEIGLLEAPADSLENLARLRMMGCGLAMDDFGAGYSSLTRLCELPFNQIKLDNTFIRNIEHRPQNRAIIRSVVALAKELNISLVVEGVETLEQSSELQQMGGTLAQGYLFARPMPALELCRFIDSLELPVAKPYFQQAAGHLPEDANAEAAVHSAITGKHAVESCPKLVNGKIEMPLPIECVVEIMPGCQECKSFRHRTS
ncbi:EAL domain-containing response regulator [Pseudomonas vancouverensis]|uniref:EAL domain-containing protein n=1 Tax=Pseudomonas vancouverensis TaxID=95300 RepID=A0A1H2N3V3_PSEVA|nr:EAL domain-containing response regulator [Pseudomonas vancouverensis]KAB0495810.1 EAL domain-containing response regulator [Pseudomonas vancouverensis]TDB65612.1 EAL domain-containing protein [Pseudomonas vancouverensis]SDU99831.1 EAL domain, c-di-GMP-specific phosphodiesterase class I (or its enzymatically inactive variant) [Pseudomonas vancouverensis]